MLYAVSAHLVGVVVFLFIFWKKLKEDYTSEIIFSTATWVLFGIFLGQVLANLFFKPYWFWFAFAGVLLGLGLSSYRFKLRFFEVSEASFAGLFPWLGLIFLLDSTLRSNIFSLAAFFFVVSAYIFYLFLVNHYKKFSWYRSGRVGFSAFTTLGIFLLLRTAASVFLPDMLSFVGRVDTIISGILGFLSFMVVFHLSRQTT